MSPTIQNHILCPPGKYTPLENESTEVKQGKIVEVLRKVPVLTKHLPTYEAKFAKSSIKLLLIELIVSISSRQLQFCCIIFTPGWYDISKETIFQYQYSNNNSN